MRIVWGFGGIRIAAISDFSENVYFDHSTGRLEFQQEYNEFVTESRILRRVFKGWRPRITVRIYNTGCTVTNGYDYDEIRHLIDIINYARRTGEPFYVQPRYDAVYTESLYYKCELVNDFTVEDGSPTAAFQTLDLEFRGIELVQQLPTFMSSPSSAHIKNDVGNTYWNGTNKYIVYH